ncbi:hypothetical protein ACRRTK_019031 [Alexandromys fortis]
MIPQKRQEEKEMVTISFPCHRLLLTNPVRKEKERDDDEEKDNEEEGVEKGEEDKSKAPEATTNRQAQIEVVPSASALIIKTLKEPPRDRKKQKNIKYSGNITFNEIVNIAWQMRHRPLAKAFWKY